MEPVKTEKEMAELRAELTVEEAWAEAVVTEKFLVALRAIGEARVRAEAAAKAGEKVGAVNAELETVRWAWDAALKEIEAINAIEAAARQRRRHDAHG